MGWSTILAVGAGGAIGAIARHFVAGSVMRVLGAGFPYGTLAVNILGAFVMGALVEAFALRLSLSQTAQAFLTVGVLGGFTTFSAFSLEVALLIERHEWGPAFIYATASVILSVLALFAGLATVRAVS